MVIGCMLPVSGKHHMKIPTAMVCCGGHEAQRHRANDMLDAFIQDPQAFIAGNRMPFDGVKDKGERDDLLAYLKQATAPASAKQLLRNSVRRRAGL